MQYFDSLAPADKRILPPTEDTRRYDELVLESLADALLDAALLCRYETTARVSLTLFKDSDHSVNSWLTICRSQA